MKVSKEYAEAIPEMIATANATFVAAQATLDQIAKDRQALQVHFNSEAERLKLEGEESGRSAKAQDAKFATAQQNAMTKKIEAEGLLAGLARLVKTSKQIDASTKT